MPGVKCQTPGCTGYYAETIESRPRLDNSIKRRRQCSVCGQRATTYERIDPREYLEPAIELAPVEGEEIEDPQLREIHQAWSRLSPDSRKAVYAFAMMLRPALQEVD